MPLNEEKITIGVVERETGFSKDLLRTWERRYGFPTPVRSDNDEREYSIGDLDRLKTIKKLLDNGMRPGKVIHLSDDELAASAASLQQKPSEGDMATIMQAIQLLKGNDLEAFSSFLTNILITQGLERFITRVAAPLNQAIGNAWFRGELNVFHEHCYSARIEMLLGRAQSFLPATTAPPLILLTTLSGEQHYLGLLMARIVMLLERANAVFLGPQLPNSEIVTAVDHFHPDITALSFSTHFPLKRAHQALLTLRSELPANVSIWAGGGQIHELAQVCPDICFFSSLEEIPPALSQWRASHQD
jgi:DNA-binding transcriptional MerR regulator